MNRLVLAGVSLVLLAGCGGLPDEGEVQIRAGEVLPTPETIHYAPPGPAADAGPGDIVTGFLDAMLASPVQVGTARSYLTRDAAATWHPERRVVVYDDVQQVDVDNPEQIALVGAAWIDAQGRWQGAFGGGKATVALPLVREDGVWRLSAAPDALLVRREWFRRHYEQDHLYFLDATRQILVPEPVFMPRGEQRATSLVRSLVMSEPAPGTTTRLEGLRLDRGAVTVTDGAARVALAGTAQLSTAAARAQLAAQLTWTLRQVASIRTVEVRIDGNPLTLEGGLTQIPVSHGAAFDPAIAGASQGLFGLDDGRPVRVAAAAEAIPGLLAGAHPLRDVSVDPLAELGAGVRADGREVTLAPLGVDAPVTTVPGEDFGHPAWDGLGHAWLLDRRAAGAVVHVFSDGRALTVDIPMISGRRVVDLLVSRDGTRLVAGVVEADGSTTIVVSRIVWSAVAVTASPISRLVTVRELRDLAWQGPTQVVALATEGSVSRIRWLSLDGAPDDLRGGSPADTILADLRAIVSSGAEDAPAWAVAPDGVLVGIGAERHALAVPGLTALTYAG